MSDPQVVERGDGISPYRARLAPEVIPVKLCGYGEGILVLRCHDHAVADATILAALRDGTLLAEQIPEVTMMGLPALRGEEVWVRWVPDDPHSWDGPGAYERELRGTIGATPALLYAERIEVDGR